MGQAWTRGFRAAVGAGWVFLAISSASSAAANDTFHDAYAALLKLHRQNYNGGLDAADRRVAERLRAALKYRFAEPACTEIVFNPFWPEKYSDTERESALRTIEAGNPEFAALIRALENPSQEIRDVSAYTLGRLGPSAHDALRFIETAKHLTGGWYPFAIEHIACRTNSWPFYPTILPGRWSALRSPRGNFFDTTALIAQLYLDPAYEYPPWMLYAQSIDLSGGSRRPDVEEKVADASRLTVPLLMRILNDRHLSRAKRVDATRTLGNIQPAFAERAHASLLNALHTRDDELKGYVIGALIYLKDPVVLPELIARLDGDDREGYSIFTLLCGYGHSGISAQDKLLDIAQNSRWPQIRADATKALGCVGSTKSVPALLKMLDDADWLVARRAAMALGKITPSTPEVVVALDTLSKTHWSLEVREAAVDALADLGARPMPSRVKHNKIPPPAMLGWPIVYNHGLSWCDESGRYSIDGKSWFSVQWRLYEHQAAPDHFPSGLLVEKDQLQEFLRAEDGWFLTTLSQNQGTLSYVSDSGKVQIFDRARPTLVGLVQISGRYFGFGFEEDWVASLFELVRSDGKWRAKRVVMLPSVPDRYAVSPSGELLLTDGPNDVAVVGGRILPLKCEKTIPEDYFAGHVGDWELGGPDAR